ncbi:MAG: PSD1 and planctomycete cytochrome C domain-containing protein [Gemmataceae bacterium]|nr:PSD1 and planctomycete cytochrome C domain-containing protein [Gemmataceae bacterium]
MSTRASLPSLLAALFLAPAVQAQETVDYLRQIKPILAEKCFTCHGALQQKGSLRLDTVKQMLEGGDHGPVIVAKQAEKSQLIDRVLGRGKARRMPPASEGEPLGAAQVALLKRWIDQGASGPADEKPEPDPRDHWAFRAPVRPPVPAVKGGPFRNPIDSFLAAERDKRGLTVQRAADRRVLLRRVYLDLIGLPPTRQEQEAFLADRAPDAYEKVVDRLLTSPQHGERWGRHWMDIWRYSDWWGLGQEVRNSQKHIWHWRDWIVESVNADKGYDQMVREMLAADELYPNDLDRLRATGFLARHYFLFNRTTWLDETIEHTSKAFLGLTMGCTKCHDHKYDPFAHADYYRFRAFFEPYQIRTEQVPGEADYAKDGIPRAYDANLDAPTYLHVRGDDRNPVKNRPLPPALPKLLTWADLQIRPVALPAEAHSPGLRPHVLENYRRAEETKREAARAALARFDRAGGTGPAKIHAEKMLASAEAQLIALEARAKAERAAAQNPLPADSKELARQAALAERRADLARAEEDLAKAELDWQQTPADKKAAAEKKRLAARAALTKAQQGVKLPGEDYTPLRGALKTRASNLETEASRNRPFPRTSTGRRTALAQWMTDRRNPLTARVAVNHIWARHFGRPLVETVFNLGRKGSPPSHPELLDWLAVEFMDSGWSMKHLHRLIVTSDAYRLSSSSAGATLKSRELDAENRWYWRMNPVRMEAQVLRDSLLSLAGELDLKLGGPTVPVADESSRRRSLYYFHSHNEQQRFLGVFDDANVLECYRRSESIVPQQALALANSKLALTMAGRLNERLHRELGEVSDAEFGRAAFEMVLATTPTADELAACGDALREWRQFAKGRPDAARRARGNLVHALLNHNDFITVR